jgi:hypothetical protein
VSVRSAGLSVAARVPVFSVPDWGSFFGPQINCSACICLRPENLPQAIALHMDSPPRLATEMHFPCAIL